MPNDDLFNKISDFLSKSTQSIRDRLTMDVTDLIRAIDDNDPEEVARALRAGVDPNKEDGLGRLPLPLSADRNQTLIVGLLLRKGANPNLADQKGETALYKAVSWENPQMVELLLEAGADGRQPTREGRSPHDLAAEKGYTALLTLIDNQKDAARASRVARDKARHEELKAEAQAARQEKQEQVAKAEAEADRKAKRQAEREKARQERRLRRQYKQLKEGDSLGALIAAIQAGDAAAAGVILDSVEDLNAIDPATGTTALMAALQQKDGATTAALIKRGADTTTVPAGHQHSPLTWVVLNGHEKLVELMLAAPKDNWAEVLNNPSQLLSPQFLAYKDAKIMNLLLEVGADPFFGGSGVPSPIIKAIEKASIAILPVLVRHKVDLNRPLDGRRPLEWAIHFDRASWLVGLIEEEVDIDLPNAEGRTPLMQAVVAGDPELVRILLNEEADRSLTDKEGQSALDLAAGNEAIAALLR